MENYKLIKLYNDHLHKLLLKKPFLFKEIVPSMLPTTSGIYVFSEKSINNIIYVGMSHNLRDRIYVKHLMGAFRSSNFKPKLKKLKNISEEEIKTYMKNNISVRWIEVELSEVNFVEHFIISILRPTYNG